MFTLFLTLLSPPATVSPRVEDPKPVVRRIEAEERRLKMIQQKVVIIEVVEAKVDRRKKKLQELEGESPAP